MGISVTDIVTPSGDLTITPVSGNTLKPTQPAVFAISTLQSSVTGAGIVATVTFTTEIFDQNNDFDGTTFTAPVTGRYFLSVHLNYDHLGASNIRGFFTIVASNRSLLCNLLNYGAIRDSNDDVILSASTFIDMDAADTVSITTAIQGGTQIIDISTGSRFSIFLVA